MFLFKRTRKKRKFFTDLENKIIFVLITYEVVNCFNGIYVLTVLLCLRNQRELMNQLIQNQLWIIPAIAEALHMGEKLA